MTARTAEGGRLDTLSTGLGANDRQQNEDAVHDPEGHPQLVTAQPDQDARLAALQRLGLLDTTADPVLDGAVELAARIFDVPTALITLVGSDRQWFKAEVGPERTQTPRDVAFCDHTIRQTGVLLVQDAEADPRFADTPPVRGELPSRFYAGAPMVTSDGATIGSLCVLDTRARSATAYQQAMLVGLADEVVRQLELRVGTDPVLPGRDRHPELPLDDSAEQTRIAHLTRLVAEGSMGFVETTEDGVIVGINAAGSRMLGYHPDELVGRSARVLAHPDHVRDTDAAVEALRSGRVWSYEAMRVYRHRSGQAVHVRSTVSYLPATATKPASVAALLFDLSPGISARAQWIDAQQDRQRVLDAATDAYIHVDDTGVVLEWNPAAERVFGYPAALAVGRELAQLIVPESQRRAHTEGLRSVAAGNPGRLLGTAVELVARHQDGRELHVELTPWQVPGRGNSRGFHAFCRDIGDRIASRAALTEANVLLRKGQAQLQAVFEASPTADAVVAPNGALVDVNPAMCRLLGRNREELLGRPFSEHVHAPDQAAVTASMRQVVASDTPLVRQELRLLNGDGAVTWGLVSLAPMGLDSGQGRAVLRIEQLQAYKDLEDALARQSTHDPVTGLHNRALFLERVRQALAAGPTGGPVAVLVLEMSGLHAVIAQDGFAAGDLLLSAAAERLHRVTEPDMTLAHLQSGVFAAVVPSGGGAAARLAERYLAVVSAPFALSGKPVVLRADIGISTASSQCQDPDTQTGQLVQDAESAARQSRAEGGGSVVFASAQMRQAQERQAELEQLIRQALDEDDVGVAYQPVFELSSGRVVAAEALLRLTDRTGRAVPPLEVVRAAESSGLIIELGSRVLQLAAAQAAQWRRDHGVLIPVAVNVSTVQLAKRTFTADVLAAIALAGVPPQALTLELTESILLEGGSAGIEQLSVLRDLGIQLAIDDFGTGYASLTYLRDLPATTLKIDRSFVEGIPHDHGAMAIVAGVIGLARNFGMTCIAEGIETEAQRAYLAECQVLGQGFLLAAPASGAAISRLVAGTGPRAGAPGADALSVAEARDAAGARRDRAGDQRDDAGDTRDQVGDDRDRVSDQRDLLADRRDEAGDLRDDAAAQRDELAAKRDRASTDRDEAATVRECEAERSEMSAAPNVAARIYRLTKAREAAASDRERASHDRIQGASERVLAGHDRTTAMTDRGAGAHEREQAELDRSIAYADRGRGAGERAHAEDDRSTAQADRGASARERDNSSIDSLTGAHIRGAGLVELDREVGRASRAGQPLVLAFLDVDNLKGVNDSAGHAAGDDLLRAVARTLRSGLRSYDLLVRYGGDEFLCVMAGMSLAEVSARLAHATAILAALPTPASFTAGLAELNPGDTSEALIARADAALYGQRRHRA